MQTRSTVHFGILYYEDCTLIPFDGLDRFSDSAFFSHYFAYRHHHQFTLNLNAES